MGPARSHSSAERAKAFALKMKTGRLNYKYKVGDPAAHARVWSRENWNWQDNRTSFGWRVPYSVVRAEIIGPVTPEMLTFFYWVIGRTGIAETRGTFELPGAILPGVALLSPELDRRRPFPREKLNRAIAAWTKRGNKCFLRLPDGTQIPFFNSVGWYKSQPGDQVQQLNLSTDKQGRMLAVAVEDRLLREIRAFQHGYVRFPEDWLLKFDRLPALRFATLMEMHADHRRRWGRCWSYTVEELAAIMGLQKSRRDVILKIIDKLFREYERYNDRQFQWAPARENATGRITHYEIEWVHSESNLWLNGLEIGRVHQKAKRRGIAEGEYVMLMPPQWCKYCLRQLRRWRRRAIDEPHRMTKFWTARVENLEAILRLSWDEKQRRGLTRAKAIQDLIDAQRVESEFELYKRECEEIDWEEVAIETLKRQRDLWRLENGRRELDGWSPPEVVVPSEDIRQAFAAADAGEDVDLLGALIHDRTPPGRQIPARLRETIDGGEHGLFGLDDLLENYIDLLTPDELAFVGRHYGLDETIP